MVGGRLWKPLKRGAGGKKVKNHWDRQSQPNGRRFRCWKLLDQPFILCRRFSTACILWTESSTWVWSVFRCMRQSGN